MSVPIVTQYLSGRNLYVVIWNPPTGQFWNKDTAAWENYNQANWTHYAITLNEYVSSGIYQIAYPTGIAAGVLSTEFVFQQNGVTLEQSQGANVQTIAGDGTAPINMAAAADLIVPNGVVATGTRTTTSFPTNLTNTQAQAFVGRVIGFTSGVLIGQETNVTGYVVTNGVLTVTALTAAPSPGDTFVML